MKKIFNNSTRVLIVGDVMKDMYVFGSTDRISPEAPVPIVRVKKFNSRAGGAANVATNLSSLGIQTTMLSVVGNDSISEEIENLLTEKKVKCIFLKSYMTMHLPKCFSNYMTGSRWFKIRWLHL